MTTAAGPAAGFWRAVDLGQAMGLFMGNSLEQNVAVIEGMVDGVVWLPTNSEGVSVRSGLGSEAGHRVAVTAATNPADLTKGGVG